MKYEMIFGDEKLFDGANDCHVFACEKDGGAIYWHDHLILSAGSVTVRGRIAMRRIIAEPTRWTVEDQKAGRLPEVGSLVMAEEVETKNNIFEFAGVCAGSKRFAVRDITDGLLYFYSKEMIVPIETPEEKAQRLKSEWCANAAKQLKNLEHTSTLTSIYDAMLRGELTIPSKDGE